MVTDLHHMIYNFSIFIRFEDVATIKVPKSCPSQVKEKGLNKFRVRAFFENFGYQDSFFNELGAGNILLESDSSFKKTF